MADSDGKPVRQLNPRVVRGVAIMLSLAVVVGVVGWAVSREDTGDSSVARLDIDATAPEPGIAANRALQGTQLPDIALTVADGSEVQLRSLVDGPTIINFWYSSCLPCAKELPAFAAVSAEVSDDVTFLGVNPKPPSDGEESFARDLGVDYLLAYDPNGVLAVDIGVSRYPVTLFVDGDGVIVRQTGELDERELRAIIDEVFG